MTQFRANNSLEALQAENKQLRRQIARMQDDITECKWTKEALRASEQRLRTIIEHNVDALIVSRDGIIRFVNPAAEAMFGHIAEDFLGQEIGIALATNGCVEVDILRKDGSRGVAEMRVVEIEWEQMLANLASFRDITGRKQAEAALRKAHDELEKRSNQLVQANQDLRRSRDLLDTIFNSINDGLLLVDRSNHVLAVNRTMTLLLERPPEEVLNHSLADIFRACQYEKRALERIFPTNWILQTFKDGHSRRHRERISCAGGKTCVLDMQTLPIFDSRQDTAQDVEQVLLHLVDVTEDLKVDALMIENERLTATRKLTEIVVHEVNSPLQTIVSLLGMLPEANPEEYKSYLALSRDEIKRISLIMNQLRNVYHDPPDTHLPVDINSLVERVLLLMSGRLARQHIQIEQALAIELPRVTGRADELTQVLLNLVSNAIEAMPEGGMLMIETAVEGEHAQSLSASSASPIQNTPSFLQIVVSDTGTGIEPDVLPHIFDPFFTTRAQGSGVGLFVCQKIVVQHGGTITVRNHKQKGTTFLVKLPLDDQRNERPALLSEESV
jgi:signal transduction histidine kinase